MQLTDGVPPAPAAILREQGFDVDPLSTPARAMFDQLLATTALVVPERSFHQLLGLLITNVCDAVLPNTTQLTDIWERRRFDYLQLALDLPDLLHDLAQRLQTRSPTPHYSASSPKPGPPSPTLLLVAATAGAIDSRRRGRLLHWKLALAGSDHGHEGRCRAEWREWLSGPFGGLQVLEPLRLRHGAPSAPRRVSPSPDEPGQ